jgi:hypothetical protein
MTFVWLQNTYKSLINEGMKSSAKIYQLFFDGILSEITGQKYVRKVFGRK